MCLVLSVAGSKQLQGFFTADCNAACQAKLHAHI
jgi:hypothetical protein